MSFLIWIDEETEEESPEIKKLMDKIDKFQQNRDRKSLQNCGKTHFEIKEVRKGKNKGKITSIAVKFVQYTQEEIANFSQEEVEIHGRNTETKWKEYGVFFGRMGE